MTVATWRADAIVLLGATGDLARGKLLPALFGLARRGRLRVPIVGVARPLMPLNMARDATPMHTGNMNQ